ncbi:uncharacterized protein PHALS_06914 [Plasmopara halstedii]|uniref:Uncharacterized protein n=1 Tax=Plasmopara halstedii TaxID=4781 RepID=A0A0P1B454_PLAHL|nr:uncharacterized protein PHALS_06914 [Plasmopara halstedii]CEG49134.1 hypothetical protein PHALS_06914 [Plasmopara halstedii]|eukprot:XP_024585503.1 hypothetical protein PHALS_06914 [Plasmopara halstedii]
MGRPTTQPMGWAMGYPNGILVDLVNIVMPPPTRPQTARTMRTGTPAARRKRPAPTLRRRQVSRI